MKRPRVAGLNSNRVARLSDAAIQCRIPTAIHKCSTWVNIRCKLLRRVGQDSVQINKQCTGRPYRYLYAAEQPAPDEMRGVMRYDWHSDKLERYEVPFGDQNSEPVSVPRRAATEEDDGWLLCCVYRRVTHTSDVVVLNARDVAAGPVATVHLPTRIPAGFHGAWLANEN
ncbi:carotenoid oxygenase family protein [Paraburkholderia sp. B3]|uniref:carotenoid oxygenase family protein n=1 Tax=Paraburkholderia sp. B3 TaxID=3134791 RepID=UPI00398271E6